MDARLTLSTFLGHEDAHYAGGLVAGARILGLFGDAATAMMLEQEGVEGLLAGYSDVTFHHPVYAGCVLEAEATLIGRGNASRRLRLEARVADNVVCTAEAVVVARDAPAARP